MRIAVLGTGNVGGSVGRALARAGNEVAFGSRTPHDTSPAEDTAATVTDVPTALAGAEAVLVAVPSSAVAGLVAEHAASLAGKLVVDCTNDIGGPGPTNSFSVIAAAVPDVRYARAFNTLGWENFQDPWYGEVVADLFFSSSAQDRPAVERLVRDVGLRPVFVGEGAHDVVDGVLPLWFALTRDRGRHVALKVLEDQDDRLGG